MKRRIAGLHQHTAIASVELRDRWVPKEEGLDPIETTRHVSVIAITLSKVPCAARASWAGRTACTWPVAVGPALLPRPQRA